LHADHHAYDVGRCHSELAQTADRGGRLEAALAEYAKVIEIMKQVMSRGYLKAGIQLLDARIRRAIALAGLGDHARATEDVEAVARQGDLDSLQLYTTACVFSRASAAADHDTKLSTTDRDRLKARYADRAMEYLRQAVAKGYHNPSVIKEDHDIDPLRARQDFQKLLQALEETPPAPGSKK
jgi:hypothetical protein